MRNRFHSLCPYFAMFPDSFATEWIERLTRPGETVLDPFCGRGTTALSATLAGRHCISCDVNDVAYCLTKAKTNPPSLKGLQGRLSVLEKQFAPDDWKKQLQGCPEFFHHAFAPSTLTQLLYLRGALSWQASRVDNMIAALALGSLHGESQVSPSYFSNQMPRTISTKPGYSIRFWASRGLTAPKRDVFSILRQRAAYRYESPLPKGRSLVLHDDMRTLPRRLSGWPEPVRCVITSPPYLDVTSFEEDQWLRLWFLGGPPHPTRGRISRDDRYARQDQYWHFIGDMWRSMGSVLGRRAHIVIRIGSRTVSPRQLERVLTASSQISGRGVHLVSSKVTQMKNRQTDAFRPGSKGCAYELDCHYKMR